MRYKLLVLFTLIFLHSCKNSTQEKKEIVIEKQIVSGNQNTEKNTKETNKVKREEKLTDCDKYWENRFPSDSIKTEYINEIISENKLTENNLNFLNALKNAKQDDWAFNQVLSPIFRLSNSEIGIFSFQKYQHIDNKLVPVSKEFDLIEKLDILTENTMDNSGEIKFYPMLLDSIFKQNNRPTMNIYTINNTDSTQIRELGVYIDECLEYFEYSIDTTNISLNDKLLFSSPFKIDLIFENDHDVDLLLEKDYKQECNDCPNSTKFQKSFARIKGTDNLYFAYADTFPINNELDTPSRALILINKNNEVIYLWYDEIDLFGCSCL